MGSSRVLFEIKRKQKKKEEKKRKKSLLLCEKLLSELIRSGWIQFSKASNLQIN